MGKDIIRKSEKKWKCAYCGFLNDLSQKSCGGCGAVRTGSEETTNILTDYEEVEKISYDDINDDLNEPDKNLPNGWELLGYIVLIVATIQIAVCIYNISTSSKKVLSKQWSYTATIADNVTQKNIVSYSKPPEGATNITIQQVMQENGWYRTQYTYDFTKKEIVRFVTVNGSENLPTFKEVTLYGTEILDSCSEVQFTITVEDNKGPVKITTKKDIWVNIQVNESYTLDKIKGKKFTLD